MPSPVRCLPEPGSAPPALPAGVVIGLYTLVAMPAEALVAMVIGAAFPRTVRWLMPLLGIGLILTGAVVLAAFGHALFHGIVQVVRRRRPPDE